MARKLVVGSLVAFSSLIIFAFIGQYHASTSAFAPSGDIKEPMATGWDLPPYLSYWSRLVSLPPELPQPEQGRETRFRVNFLEAHELKDWLQEGKPFRLVDARWPQEYHRGHIPTAVSVPRAGISNPGYRSSNASAKEGGRQVPVVFYCNGPAWGKMDPCVRAIVRELLTGSEVYWFKGGMRAWRAHGYPVVQPERETQRKG